MVLLTLASAQFLMTLDASVMNVSIATVARDVGTTIVGIQTAITLYTLVMASLMITGGKIGQIIGRRRAFRIGLVIYACGSLITAIATSLPVLMLGWSVLEGIGAALIMPAVVALVASNFGRPERPRAYGLVASAGAIAVAVGPLVGGLFTTYASWRWVFVGEVLVAFVIMLLTRRISDTPAERGARLDLVGTALSALGLGLVVFGILRLGTWGFAIPKPGAPEWLGLSPVVWLIFGGGCVLLLFMAWERRQIARHQPALFDPAMLRSRLLRGGLAAFFFQFLVQAGMFFAVSLYLSVALGLSAIETGVRLMPLTITLLLAAVGIPKVFPNASPRLVARLGFLALFAGIAIFVALLDVGTGPEITTWPMLLAGLGIGALASQLGSVTVSAVPDEQSGEVGGLQNTAINLGMSIGTAAGGSGAHLGAHGVVLYRHTGQSGGPQALELQGRGPVGERRPVYLRRRPQSGARPSRRSRRHRGRDRRRKCTSADCRPARIVVGPRRHHTDRAVFRQRPPDPPAWRDSRRHTRDLVRMLPGFSTHPPRAITGSQRPRFGRS